MLEYVAVLGLPKGSLISLDGCEIQVQRDDFVGFVNFPQQDGPTSNMFHWLTIRTASPTHQPQNQVQQYSPIAVGFHVSCDLSHFAVNYDPYTEEVSPGTIDEATRINLLEHIRSKSIHPLRILSYNQVVSSENKNKAWKSLTKYISSHLLEARHICPGRKIVPGSYDDNSAGEGSDLSRREEQDGTEIWFPRNIPVLSNESGVTKQSLSHAGTKRFLTSLDTTSRTTLSMDAHPADMAFQRVLRDIYSNSWMDMIGDIELSFFIFMELKCFNALEHWRDLVAMVANTSKMNVTANVDMYNALLVTLEREVHAMENDLFDDVDLSGNNFLTQSFKNLTEIISGDQNLVSSLKTLQEVLKDKIPSLWNQIESDSIHSNFSVEKDEDEPVVVSPHEIEAYRVRSEANKSRCSAFGAVGPSDDVTVRENYPILYAAIQPHEDVLMTCARALDDANDVSLVREAASYLEEVEARKTGR